LVFLSGLKNEIANAIILYNPLNLKEAYKLTRQKEKKKSLDSKSKLFKLTYISVSAEDPKQNNERYKEDNQAFK
jgi:hypothetical protein